MSNEKIIYLNVNPLNNEPQLIHMETILNLGSIAFTGKFDCKRTKDKKIKVNNIEFEMYEMAGKVHFGFKNIILDKNTTGGKRVINIELGIKNSQKKYHLNLNNENICWETKDIIVNKITFNLSGLKMNRESLIDTITELNIEKESYKLLIPINGRPCQFKLVSEME